MHRRGYWVPTYTGRRFYPCDPRPADVDIVDIAHHLACINRFNGALQRPYSVAQHSVTVAEALPPELRLVGLLHDAAEAYVGDLVSPIKRELRAFQLLEDRVWEAIAERFDLPRWIPREVKQADQRALAAEAAQLHAGARALWAGTTDQLPLDICIEPQEWWRAREVFLERFHELTGGRYTAEHPRAVLS